MDDKTPVDDELLRMTGNQRLTEALRNGLRQLSRSTTQPELAEMATELLAGRTTIRELGQSTVYATQLENAVSQFKAWERELSADEREELEQQARRQFGDSAQHRPDR